jgi:hypothetical protein
MKTLIESTLDFIVQSEIIPKRNTKNEIIKREDDFVHKENINTIYFYKEIYNIDGYLINTIRVDLSKLDVLNLYKYIKEKEEKEYYFKDVQNNLPF